MERKSVVGCGKQGVLEFNKALYEAVGFSDEEIIELLMWDKENLKEGYYTIDKFGVKYND